ncbi:hypothetical protein DM860_011338 [Cuscuta australis]|uniref:Proteasome subunit beta n=1 Tax=Cuscuta australis TaxID=267555 RepID=A0A328DQQ3_9ASTE|nr:hypothetical protein DM860_011338 [Cuscuta australis]
MSDSTAAGDDEGGPSFQPQCTVKTGTTLLALVGHDQVEGDFILFCSDGLVGRRKKVFDRSSRKFYPLDYYIMAMGAGKANFSHNLIRHFAERAMYPSEKWAAVGSGATDAIPLLKRWVGSSDKSLSMAISYALASMATFIFYDCHTGGKIEVCLSSKRLGYKWRAIKSYDARFLLKNYGGGRIDRSSPVPEYPKSSDSETERAKWLEELPYHVGWQEVQSSDKEDSN